MKRHFLTSGLFLLLIHCNTFSQGSTYTGSYQLSSPIVLENVSNTTISGLEISNANGRCISLSNCSNIIIQNCKLGPSLGEGVYLCNCRNITVTNCTMEKIATGVVADQASGIKVTYNDIKNVLGPMPRGQLVQFGNVSGTGNLIAYNSGENIIGQSSPEDAISLYMSNGTATDPIQVVGNWIRGGGPSTSGGGIMAGDMGGSYILIKDNILVNPGQYGITVSSGNDITITGNKIFGQQLPFNNIGLSAFKQYNINTYNITISNNEVNYTNNNGVLNNMWNAGNCGTVVGWSTNKYNPNLTAAILPATIIGRAKIQSVTTDVNLAQTNADFNIYPNQEIKSLIVELGQLTGNNKLIVYGLNGQKLLEQSILNNRTEVDLSKLIDGVYIAKLSGDNSQNVVKKFIVQK